MKKYYQQSTKILKKIQHADNILINVHKNPDCDTVGSVIAIYDIIYKVGKKASIISPSKIDESFNFLKQAKKIKTINFSNFDFSKFDLFLILDSSSYDRVTGSKEILLPKNLETIVIDHHKTNNFRFPLQIVDADADATAEIIYKIIKDLRFKINKEIATALFSGIAGDTVFFKYAKNPAAIFSVAADLLKKGADYKKFISIFYDNNEFAFTKLMGLFLSKMKLEKKRGINFVWSAIPYPIYARFHKPPGIREAAADMFFRSIKGTDLGIAMLETKKGELSVSFRSKDKVDASLLAKKLGGGGHKNAAGCTVNGEFNKAVKKVLSIFL